jgi:hypothetical protein
MGIDTAAGTKNAVGGGFVSRVIKTTIGRGHGRVLGPVGVSVSALHMATVRRRCCWMGLTRKNHRTSYNEWGQMQAVFIETKRATPSRGGVEGALGSYIVADDEQDFTLSEVHVPQKNTNKYEENT